MTLFKVALQNDLSPSMTLFKVTLQNDLSPSKNAKILCNIAKSWLYDDPRPSRLRPKIRLLTKSIVRQQYQRKMNKKDIW